MRKNEIVNLTLITRVLTSAVGITLDWAHVCLKKSGPGRVWDAYTEQQSAAIFDGRELRCRIIMLKIFTSAFYHAAGKPIGWLGLAHIISFISVLANRWECEHTHKTIVDTNEENLKMVASRKDGSTSISFRVTWRVVAAIPYLQNSAGESRKETGKPEKYILRWIETVARKNVRGGCSFAGFALNTSKIYFTLYLKQSKWHNYHTLLLTHLESDTFMQAFMPLSRLFSSILFSSSFFVNWKPFGSITLEFTWSAVAEWKGDNETNGKRDMRHKLMRSKTP